LKGLAIESQVDKQGFGAWLSRWWSIPFSGGKRLSCCS